LRVGKLASAVSGVDGFEAKTALSRKDFGVLADTPIIGGSAVLGDTVDITIDVEALKTD
jgi:polyisoprenoid-binding protein YceI